MLKKNLTIKWAGLWACLFPGITLVQGQTIPPKAFLVCGDTKVLIVDYVQSKDSIPAVIWEWDAKTAADLPEAEKPKFRTMDDCKSIENGRRLLVSSSSGAVAVIDIATKKIDFRADVPNAHSIALLPGNFLAAAASTHKAGNMLMLFDLKKGNKPIYTDTLYSAHGAVWNAGHDRLYALGYKVLREYKQAGEKLELVQKWAIPGIGGHELMMAPGGQHLFMTEHHGAWKFDIKAAKFEKIAGFPDAENIKSLGQDKSGQYIYTVPEESWWTFHVRFLNPLRAFAFPGLHVYKARWFWH
ncbi:DUF6528 family protein [Dyadobacter aurulentus]|uniref:DUF6528 family protein n=1 Tax=Dyadobacter sp. UC 10 TaxID=2605428 RepID=UPI0011F30884|nr:DUF6528 family protein [Dyadobacter sp. UC 10]KAA0992673.1 hypothetical protein FXO21_22110 [Dyadobacter sp. UC 10]